jgi:uncharacterized protein YwqG
MDCCDQSFEESLMPAFLSKQDICRALADQNLSQFEDRVLATVKPAIDFIRRQKEDRNVPAGISKMGGSPDLPSGFRWPTRPALPAQADIEAVADHKGGLDSYDQLRTAALRTEFPLAFFAQLNLGSLSLEAGFDLDLPDHGMIYIFEDITADDEHEAYRVFWIDDHVGQLERRIPPDELILLSDAKEPIFPFAAQTMTELLEPYSVLTVPFHWLQSSGSSFSRMHDFLERPSTDYYPQSEAAAGEQVGPFGDRLGGWPVPIQHNPEPKFRRDRSKSFEPGDDEIRLLFSWAGEYFAGTLLMHSLLGGDGVTHLMMQREDLLARRFDKVRALYQYT